MDDYEYTGLDYDDTADHLDLHDVTTGTVGIFGRITPQTYAFLYIIGSLVLLWLLGGVLFRRANH